MDQSEFSRGAEPIAEFLEVKARISLGGPILRPLLVTCRLVLLASILISAPYLIRRILESGTLFHYQRLWMSLALFVYFFGVSGTMHNLHHP
ncbi:hypothetical protein ZIOFF_062322 [Zingiber officinale]|nr:hypothetical protein ZIOFF_062322 [Zingiber officinale]